MDFRLISVRGQLSGRASSSGLVVAERYGYGRGPGVAPGRAAGSTSGCSGQGIREGGGQAATGAQTLTWAAAVRVATPRPAAGNGRAGFGLAVAVPVPAGDDAAFAEVVQGAAVQGRGDGGGQAGGGGTGPGAVQAGAAGGGEGDVPGLHRLPGEAALAGGGGLAGGGAGQGADELGAADPGGVLLIDQLGVFERRIGPAEGPAPAMADLASFSAVSDPVHRQA